MDPTSIEKLLRLLTSIDGKLDLLVAIDNKLDWIDMNVRDIKNEIHGTYDEKDMHQQGLLGNVASALEDIKGEIMDVKFGVNEVSSRIRD